MFVRPLHQPTALMTACHTKVAHLPLNYPQIKILCSIPSVFVRQCSTLSAALFPCFWIDKLCFTAFCSSCSHVLEQFCRTEIHLLLKSSDYLRHLHLFCAVTWFNILCHLSWIFVKTRVKTFPSQLGKSIVFKHLKTHGIKKWIHLPSSPLSQAFSEETVTIRLLFQHWAIVTWSRNYTDNIHT